METGTTPATDLGVRRGGMVPELAGTSGRLAVEVDGKIIGDLVVEDGRVELGGDSAPAQGTIAFRSAEDLWKTLRGELNPVVAALQGRMTVQGDLALAIKVMLSVSAASPFAAGAGSAKGG